MAKRLKILDDNGAIALVAGKVLRGSVPARTLEYPFSDI